MAWPRISRYLSRRVRRPGLWTFPFVVAATANFFHGLAVMLLLHLPGLLGRWGASATTVGLVAAAMAAGAVAVRPFVGRAMDGRAGRRGVVVLGGLGHVVACAGYLALDEVGPALWAVRVLHGLSEGALFAALFTTAADVVPVARRVQGLALFGVSGMLPVALGGVIGDVVLARADYRELFLLALGCSAIAFAASLALPETGTARARLARADARSFLAVAVQADLWPIWVLGIAFAAAVGAAYAFLRRFVDEAHVGSVGLFYGWYSSTAILLRFTLGFLPDRVGPRRVLTPSIVVTAVALVVLAVARSAFAVALAGALAGLGHGFVFPILSGLTAGRARDAERGSAMSMFTAIFDLGTLLAMPVFGPIADATSLRAMFFVAAAVPIAGLFAFFAWDPDPAPDGAVTTLGEPRARR